MPGCVQRPRVPFAIAGAGPRSIDVAARHGQLWVTLGDPAGADPSAGQRLATVRRQMALVDEACERVGRNPASLDRLYLQGLTSDPWLASVEAFRELAGRYGELGFTDLALHWPRPEAPYESDPAVFEAILAEADRPGDLG